MRGSPIHPSENLGPATTNTKLCQVCTPVVNNEDSCSTMTNCLPQVAQATVQVGSSPVHVGTLTSSALYTSVSSALDVLCPTVSQTRSMTSCSTGTVTIGKIPYSDGDNGLLEPNGQLIVKVDASQYNATSLRNAMINSAALTAMHSAMGKSNCYTAHYTIETLRKRDMYFWNPMRRWLSLQAKRDHPHPESESATWCNAASFAGVQYYDQFWRSQPTPGSTDYIDASWDFHVAPGGAFACEFIQDLIDALGVIQPEFAVADIELGEAIGAACMKAMEHA